MKRYLTTIFVSLSMISVFVGFMFDVRWSGVASWGLAFIFLLFATYFTKYIPNETEDKRDPQQSM